MNKAFYLCVLASVILLVAVSGCTAGEKPVIAPTAAPTAASVPKSSWEEKWQTAVREAKKEGTLNVYAFWPPQTMKALGAEFKNKYGINVEFTVLRGSELLPKVQAERVAGLTVVDVYGNGATTLITNIRSGGYLGEVAPLLLLPEVLDAKAWRGGQVPFADKAHQVIQMSAIPQRYAIYNTELVKPAEFTSYKDALNPKFKGKINLYDPTIGGTGSSLLSHIAYNLWNLEEAKDFLKQLLTQQDVFVTRDYRIQTETVARGKYAIGLGAQASAAVEFIDLGAPIDVPQIRDLSVTSEAGNLGVPDKYPHPNATLVFVNWLLSKEGQSVYSRTIGSPVMRVDVSVEGINPIFRLKPEDKVYMETEEYRYFKEQMQKSIKEIMDTYYAK